MITANRASGIWNKEWKKERKLGLGSVVRWPIGSVRRCDNCWRSDGGMGRVPLHGVRLLYRVLRQIGIAWEFVLLSCTGC